jgi:hypothetical protein
MGYRGDSGEEQPIPDKERKIQTLEDEIKSVKQRYSHLKLLQTTEESLCISIQKPKTCLFTYLFI